MRWLHLILFFWRNMKIADQDLLQLEKAKSKKLLAQAQVEKSIVEQQSADLEYRYLVMSIYMKYKLTAQDSINPDTGEILTEEMLKEKQEDKFLKTDD